VSDNLSFVLEFTNLKLRILDSDGNLVKDSSGNIIVLTTPWTYTDIRSIQAVCFKPSYGIKPITGYLPIKSVATVGSGIHIDIIVFRTYPKLLRVSGRTPKLINPQPFTRR
jgi:hypothetical protein